MKLKYKHQDFQNASVSAVMDLFAGQEKKTSTFSIVYTETVTKEKTITLEQVQAVINHLQEKGYITPSGEVCEEAKAVAAENPIDLPVELAPMQAEVRSILQTSKTIIPEKLTGYRFCGRSRRLHLYIHHTAKAH